MFRRAVRPILRRRRKLTGAFTRPPLRPSGFSAVDSKGVAATGDVCEWRAPIRVKPDVKRVSGGYRVAFAAIPRARRHSRDVRRLRSQDRARSSSGRNRRAEGRKSASCRGRGRRRNSARRRPRRFGGGLENGQVARSEAEACAEARCARATMTSRFEPKDTAAAFSALDRLAKIPDAKVLGGSVELNGQAIRRRFPDLCGSGETSPFAATELDRSVKELARLLDAPQPDGQIALDAIAFPVRARPHELLRRERRGLRPRRLEAGLDGHAAMRACQLRLRRHLPGARLPRAPDEGPRGEGAGVRGVRPPPDRSRAAMGARDGASMRGRRATSGTWSRPRRAPSSIDVSRPRGSRAGRWGADETAVQRLFGKELLVLLWAVELPRRDSRRRSRSRSATGSGSSPRSAGGSTR